MESSAPGRAELIRRTEEILESGVTEDEATGKPIEFQDPKDRPVPLDGDMAPWVHLDRYLVGARTESGFLPPSAIHAELERRGMRNKDNIDTAKVMLDALAIGRNIATNEGVEREGTG